MKCSHDPLTGVSLHGPECLHEALKAAALVVSQLSSIYSDQKDAHMVQELFVFGAESVDGVFQRHHCFHHGEGLGGIMPQMLLKEKQPIKEETQIPPVDIGA